MGLALISRESRRFYIIVALGIWTTAIALFLLFLYWLKGGS
jgi:hypothetical protein